MTHNLSILPEVDRVVVIENGRIVEQGTYEEVMALGGITTSFVNAYQMDQTKSEYIHVHVCYFTFNIYTICYISAKALVRYCVKRLSWLVTTL